MSSPGLRVFWVVEFSGRLTFLSASHGKGGGETIKALRAPDVLREAPATAWEVAELKLSRMPDGVTVERYDGAAAFNQHIALLAYGGDGKPYLRFARTAGPLAEVTRSLDIGELTERRVARGMQDLFRFLTFLVLLGVLIGLFVFRRGSMVQMIQLPPGFALAFTLQRVLAWLIDFAPFALAAAIALDTSWRQSLKVLFQWGIVSDSNNLPDEWQKATAWWALSVCGHTVYMLAMELIAGRTVGKVLARVRVLSETGRNPTTWQLVARNLTRLIEYTPQFWPFVLLVLLSRNRQRLGDIFARTVAVRLTTVPPDEGESADRAARRRPDATDGEPPAPGNGESAGANQEKPPASDSDDD